MSIQSLIKLRTESGMAPTAVWVLVGDVPAWIEDAEDTIIIKPGHTDFDFRAVTGLHVDIFLLGKHPTLEDETVDAIERSNPASVGLACSGSLIGLNAAHALVLETAWRMMTWN